MCRQPVDKLSSTVSVLSTANLIRPSFRLRATIFLKVFWPNKFPQTKFCPTKGRLTIYSWTCKLHLLLVNLKCSKELSSPTLKYEWCNIPLWQFVHAWWSNAIQSMWTRSHLWIFLFINNIFSMNNSKLHFHLRFNYFGLCVFLFLINI